MVYAWQLETITNIERGDLDAQDVLNIIPVEVTHVNWGSEGHKSPDSQCPPMCNMLQSSWQIPHHL